MVVEQKLADNGLPVRKRNEAYVIDCNGRRAIVSAVVEHGNYELYNYWAVGQMVSIAVGASRIVGVAYKVDVPDADWAKQGRNVVHVHIELVGEVSQNKAGTISFSNGIANYPTMGSIAHRIRASDLTTVYENTGDNIITIGHLSQDASVPATVDLDMLLSRHFAVVGSTGVGKSTSVTLMLRKIVERRPDLRVLILDPHNEFTSAFPDHAVSVDARTMELPFWLFKLDEFAEVIFRGQRGLEVERELLRDLIPLARERYRAGKDGHAPTLVRRAKDTEAGSADTPLPYRAADLIAVIDDRLGQLDAKTDVPALKSLRNRIDGLVADPRFAFMFTNGGDTIEKILGKLFRIPQDGKPICVFELSGLPSEVVASAVSVMCRLAFDLGLSSNGAVQTLVVCEEAHRYIPADANAGFWPTRQAIARIAKEGRKYGVYLGIVTQRPGELDPTILSQCNTLFAMRLSNKRDQDIVADAVTNGAQSTIGFLSSIANRECIAFGEAIHTPMRMTFETIAREDLPGARIHNSQAAARSGGDIALGPVIARMRNEHQRPQASRDALPEQVQVAVAGGQSARCLENRIDDQANASPPARQGLATPAALRRRTSAPAPAASGRTQHRLATKELIDSFRERG